MIGMVVLLALGEQYLTRDQALKLVFPDCSEVLERTIPLDEDVLARAEERYGGPVARSQRIFVGVRDGRVAGFAMIHTEVTKSLPATFIVGVSAQGEVTQVAVMSHEDHIGTDCRRSRFVDQFQGKTSAHRVTVPNGGILHVSGATLSCQAVARAVRKTLAIVQYSILDRPDGLRSVLQEEPVRQRRFLMGTFCTITACGDADAVERAFAEIGRLEKVLSNYDDKSELSRLHRERTMQASPDLLRFVGEARRYAEITGGAFDVTVAPLVRLWGFKDGRTRVPSEGEITAELRKVGSARIEIDGATVRLPEGMELDPGGIGKGIAVDAAADALRKAGVKRALVDFGSSAFALGRWELAIRDPSDPDKVMGTLIMEDESLSTSGSYEKFFKKDSQTYTHILDPRTGRPVQGVAGVSIVAPTGTESDAMSTAVFVGKALPARGAALLVTDKGEVRMTEEFRKRFRRAGN